jgi:hypothetical protein
LHPKERDAPYNHARRFNAHGGKAVAQDHASPRIALHLPRQLLFMECNLLRRNDIFYYAALGICIFLIVLVFFLDILFGTWAA